MWAYNINNIARSKYIFLENNKIEMSFSNYIFGLTFQSPSSKQSLFTNQKLEKMLKPINRQLKFIKEDKRFFVTLNNLN